jgi:hypothetical protein
LLNPFTLTEDVILVFNLIVTSDTKGVAVNTSISKVILDREGFVENSPHKSSEFWWYFQLPKFIPYRVMVVCAAC